MSNLYVTEPAPNGKVILDTTAGDVEIELWGKEAPKAVRNFLQLALEGYYDGVIFHRIVKGFVAQSGDPTGTGMGGESIYGEPFQDEIHPRLRFNRRGLIGMANSGKRNTNTSQFYITLDKAEELTGKHTLFGRIMGNTIYNVLTLGEVDVDESERPLRPPKIRTVRIIENPFEDIVPRITASERKAQIQAKLEAKREGELRAKRTKVKKNTGLLSFGEAEEIPSEEKHGRKKGMSREDLLESEMASSKKQKTEQSVELPESLQDLGSRGSKEEKKKVDLKDIRAQHEREKQKSNAARESEIKRMQEDLRKLKKQSGNASDSSDSDDGKRRKGPSYLEQEMAKYAKNRGRAALAKQTSRKGKRDEEDDILAAMSQFSKKVKEEAEEEEEERLKQEERDKRVEQERLEMDEEMKEADDNLEVDDDVGWLKHSLRFDKIEDDSTRRVDEDYTVIDPRAKAKRLAEQDRLDRGRRSDHHPAGSAGRHR